MYQAFDTVAPVFGLILIGYVLSFAGVLGKTVGEGLSTFVFVLGIPVLLFTTLTRMSPPGQWPWDLWATYFGAVAVAWITGWAIAIFIFGEDQRTAAVAGVGSAYANTMLMGLPLIFAVLGNAGALPLFLILAVHLPIMTLAATIQIEWASHKGASSKLLLDICKGFARNPIMLGLSGGLIWNAIGLSIPSAPAKMLEMIAQASVPCALIAMGTALRHYGLRGAGGLAVSITFVKLVVHPVAVWLLATQVFHLPPAWTTVAVMFAAAPAGINTFILATRYNIAVGMLSSAIALGTLLSVFSFAAAVWVTTG
ncbi:hypothetical protein FHS85_002584 [Rhodoligotrophos appendicifer]|uniref:AEC family transporter n=1 Tax=Rhodoligotrophos appendicifer TaxID=987056 RepID=UPI0011868A04|nr:AEC family transporter [Rhodoligotrophos appendicifer]